MKTPINSSTPQIFLSYAREDLEVLVQLYEDLTNRGFKPWLDKKEFCRVSAGSRVYGELSED